LDRTHTSPGGKHFLQGAPGLTHCVRGHDVGEHFLG
jgi:hypothetical protein